MWQLYILLCQDGSLYTGVTNNLTKRFQDHLEGKGARYTKSHKPLKIIYTEALSNHSAALKRELEIKSWTRQQKISNLHLQLL